jgi:damage-control phosphatase, subfamily I
LRKSGPALCYDKVLKGKAMKVIPACRPCLTGLARTVVSLSGDDPRVLDASFSIVDQGMAARATPPAVANRILKFVRETTGVADPFAAAKEQELWRAREALSRIDLSEDPSLLLALKLSAIGNANDFFVSSSHGTEGVKMVAELDKINKEIYNKGRKVLILGDNVGDFLFDMPLTRYLEGLGKDVVYAVKEGPAQNDLSLDDVKRFGLEAIFPAIITTGNSEVGLRRRSMKGMVKNLWESDALIVAKGMGNYETLSEYTGERPVIHIMKVKCPAVAAATGHSEGTYVALMGGE